MPDELPDILHPPSFSAEDVIGECPLVMLWHGTRVVIGWLVLANADRVEILNDLPQERFQSSSRHGIARSAITQVRFLSDQPRVPDAGGPARGSSVLG